MVTHHECVVRLKGDTLIYARLTDELTVLQEAGIPYQVLLGSPPCLGQLQHWECP